MRRSKGRSVVVAMALAIGAALIVHAYPVQGAVAPSTPSYAPMAGAQSPTEANVRADRRGVSGTPTTMTLFAVEAPDRSCTVTTDPEWQWCTISGLNPNQVYTFRQRASNASGTSGASPASDSVTLPAAVYSVGSGPSGVAISPDRVHAWIANTTSNTVSRITLADGTSTQVAVGSGPLGVAADDTFAYVTNSSGNSLTRVSTSGLTTTMDLSGSCTGPRGIVLMPGGGTAFIACSSNHVVQRVNLDTFTPGAHVSVPGGARLLAVNPAGSHVFTWGSAVSPGTLSRIQLSDNAVSSVATTDNDVTGIAANSLSVFTLQHSSALVRKFNAGSLTLEATVSAGTQAGGLAVNPAGTTGYAVVTNQHLIQAIDLDSMVPGKTIRLGECTTPQDAAVSSDDSYLIVSSSCGGGRGWNYTLGIPDRPGIPPRPTAALATAT